MASPTAEANVQSTTVAMTPSPPSAIKPPSMPTPPTSLPPSVPRTISELVSIRAREARDRPILGYPSQGVQYVEYSYGDLDDFTNAAAQHLARETSPRHDSTAPESVIALLGLSTLDYLITALALSRLGFTVLFLSTRISEAAYLSLLEATRCSTICIHQNFARVTKAIRNQRPEVTVLKIPSRDKYVGAAGASPRDMASHLDPEVETSKIAWIIHSSGSTGPPKPIYQTHAAALRNYDRSMNMEGLITLPLFHAHGLSTVFRGMTVYKKIFMYNASIPLTSQNLLDTMRTYRFEVFYGVPYALKLLSETDEGIEVLSRLKVVMFGGSACPDGLGDLLVERGVNLVGHYGTTETGQLMTSARPAGDKAWNYVRVHDKLAPFVRFEARGGNLHELVVLDGWPSKVATNRDDGSYATKDLFEPHASIEGAWKYAGRLDDTIVLMNGEKAIPIAMEMALRQNPLVKDAVVFGSGRARLGVIVVASEAGSSLKPGPLRDQLWPTVEAQNRDLPAYAQISREMVSILPADTAYPVTDKGTLIRLGFYKAFAQHIDEIYQQLESCTSGTLVLDGAELRQWLKDQIVALVSGTGAVDVQDDTDLFSLGVDSLQSSRFRAAILQNLQLNGNSLPQNIVFEQPSIAQLAQAILAIRDGTQTTRTRVEDFMTELIAKYSQFPRHAPVPSESSDRIVVVTGVTGSLGAHVVAQLANRDDVTEVCCLVRASSPTHALQRTIKSLNERAVYHTLSQDARHKITAHPADFAQARLGLDPIVYERLETSMVSLIHCAWSVNFNMSLASFEADCIAGTYNLILLCLAARSPEPASFNFCSSVSAVARTPGPSVPEALPESLECAQGIGYAQSKLVTEHIVARAAAETGMAARVLRVGQIVADTCHGIWNDTEAIPLMLQAATTLGALPALDERPRWLPVDVVASAVNDISLSPVDKGGVFFNLVNPNQFHWTDDLLPAMKRAGLSFETVDQREWVRQLRNSNTDVVANPTYKLLEFFATKYDHDRPGTAGLEYHTAAAEGRSPALSTCPGLTQDLVDKFVKHFLATSWAPTRSPGGTAQTTQSDLLG